MTVLTGVMCSYDDNTEHNDHQCWVCNRLIGIILNCCQQVSATLSMG